MFGKKKKQAQLEVERREQEALLQQQAAAQPIEETPATEQNLPVEDNSLPKEYESIAYILKQETGEDLMALPIDDSNDVEDIELEEIPELEELLDDADESEEYVEDSVEEEVEEAPVVTSAPTQDTEEVVYIVDGPTEDDDEIVKPAKLVKLPNLVDYMLSQNMSKKMKINIATLLLTAYNKYKNVPEEKKIVIQCMSKVMSSLLQDSQH